METWLPWTPLCMSRISSIGKSSWFRTANRELVLGRFQRVDGLQLLESENREYGPLVLSKGRDWRILGKVIWLFRQMP